ncbi:MAG: DNA mismatch repair protein MutT [Oceanospirillaceae bacterium]|uniref:NUDIX domain-containing protein n=1 Tax=unclassified Thalassolituus TaxID=2624967 RepID=UPI000C0B767C|nr:MULTISPECIES: NUDIX hydrolase [unclassified Thalassolituus]MAK89921.1 DNA mismatch repair protein MutT [Thalassolituus sp.]MAS24082.1 DNA mismatch repair protein MutT [Oceanospirillaceae bacterium]MAX99602.1 DNA mismatch repair protein MutT [Oceanospirillaceae bacterium]MBL35173.1 DNA mismatch repair protein MutT [Oceanospirillaceae bacterium]MBS51337.1 DNA mismatch repair protein MutT [Oceanospirillaceae bacterium]|tara:strand:+ start:784 stop:1329 length:546 start_codon:yes stop_codon:yes gene_type:complete
MADDNPWTILETDVVYDNPWIRVEHNNVLNPAGNPGIYGTVSFKNRAVAVVPLADNGDTWLVGQYRFPLHEYHWEVPMGGAPAGESALDCAIRELKEETGLEAAAVEELCRLHTSNCITDEAAVAFIAKGLTEGEAEPEETEQLTLKRLPFNEALAMAMDGRITDAISVAALMKVRLLGLA